MSECGRYLNLWNASWCGWDACQLEFAELVIVLSHRSLTLEHLDKYCGLVVLVSGKSLTLLCWDNSVSERRERNIRKIRVEVMFEGGCLCCCVHVCVSQLRRNKRGHKEGDEGR